MATRTLCIGINDHPGTDDLIGYVNAWAAEPSLQSLTYSMPQPLTYGPSRTPSAPICSRPACCKCNGYSPLASLFALSASSVHEAVGKATAICNWQSLFLVKRLNHDTAGRYHDAKSVLYQNVAKNTVSTPELATRG